MGLLELKKRYWIVINTKIRKANKATYKGLCIPFFTFVAVDKTGKPKPVPTAVPETEQENKLYEGALRRRQLRLILAGRLMPSDALELKAIFDSKI